MKSASPTCTRHSRGFTLIEVLVAVVVLSIGLLGLASLQATGLKQNHSALMRSQATILAYDILDRMRANRTAALNGNYNLAMNDDPPAGDTVAVDDLAAWRTKIASVLPGSDGSDASGSIANANGAFQITVQWNDQRAENAAGETLKTVRVDTQL